MSQRRSGLLSGLVVGFIAMLLTAAAFAAALYFGAGLPLEVRRSGDALALPAAAGLVAGLLVGLATRAVRPRSLLLLPSLSALYACAAVAVGFVAWTAARALLGAGLPLESADIVIGHVTAGFVELRNLLQTSWRFWLMGGVAAVPAFALPLTRAVRLRRVRSSRHTRHRKEGPAPQPAEPESEPEHRAPFEPVQPSRRSAPAATMNLFAPRRPDQG